MLAKEGGEALEAELSAPIHDGRVIILLQSGRVGERRPHCDGHDRRQPPSQSDVGGGGDTRWIPLEAPRGGRTMALLVVITSGHIDTPALLDCHGFITWGNLYIRGCTLGVFTRNANFTSKPVLVIPVFIKLFNKSIRNIEN